MKYIDSHSLLFPQPEVLLSSLSLNPTSLVSELKPDRRDFCSSTRDLSLVFQ